MVKLICHIIKYTVNENINEKLSRYCDTDYIYKMPFLKTAKMEMKVLLSRQRLKLLPLDITKKVHFWVK